MLKLRTSNRINDRYALAIIGHEDQGSQGYSACGGMAEITPMQGQCGHNEKGMMNQGYAALILTIIL